MENAQGKIPDCFSQKFSRVEWVDDVGAVQDEAALLRFLKSLNWLRGIRLGGAELSPEFYDQLPASIEFHGWINIKFKENEELEFRFY